MPQDKEAKSGKVEEKEGRESCDLKGQEDLGGNEADSKDEDSETDYSSGDEEVLTKAGRPVLSFGNRAGSGWDACTLPVGAVLSPCSDGMPALPLVLSSVGPLSGAHSVQAAAAFLVLSSIQCWFIYNSSPWGDSPM